MSNFVGATRTNYFHIKDDDLNDALVSCGIEPIPGPVYQIDGKPM